MELNITERAQDVVRSFMEQSEGDGMALRIGAQDGGIGGTKYELTLVADTDREEDDVQVDMGDFIVFVSGDSVERLEGATVDFVERMNESGFEIRPAPAKAPRVEGEVTGELAEKVKEVLEAQVNPAVSAHGGEILLRDVKGTEIFIEMGGGCRRCSGNRGLGW